MSIVHVFSSLGKLFSLMEIELQLEAHQLKWKVIQGNKLISFSEKLVRR